MLFKGSADVVVPLLYPYLHFKWKWWAKFGSLNFLKVNFVYDKERIEGLEANKQELKLSAEEKDRPRN